MGEKLEIVESFTRKDLKMTAEQKAEIERLYQWEENSKKQPPKRAK